MLKKINTIIMYFAYAAMLALCIILLFVAYSKAAEPVNIPGTPVVMQPPQGFELASNFSGFINKDNNASIVVVVFPDGAANTISRIFIDKEQFTKAMKPLGFEVKNRTQLLPKNTDVPLMIYHGIQNVEGQPFDKWATLIAHGGFYMVTIQAPQNAYLAPKDVEATFQSITFNSQFSINDQINQLPFRFMNSALFTPTATILGNGVSLKMLNQQDDIGDITIFILKDNQNIINDDPIIAQNLYLASIMQVFKLQKTSVEENTRFLQRDGRLLIGTGITTKGDEQDIILYTAIDRDHRAIYLQALAPKGKLHAYQNIIANIANSVQSKI